ncbi:MAG TPA: hypothetical protein VGQ81_16200 [Acidobacteriota bacterium]|nr:hypothetical protein [Acidobacteriota bacterium]
MGEFAKSLISLPWAMSAFGVQQVANLFTSAKEPTRKTEESFYAVTQAAERQFNDLIWATFQVGDEVQRDMVDFMFDMLTLKAFTPSYLSRLGSDVVRQSTEAARVMMPGNNRLARQQLKNNYEVYNLVKHVHDLLNIPSDGEFPLAELVQKAYDLGPYPDLWAVEGLGHDYADSVRRGGKPIRNILTSENARVLPAKSLTMLHAGIGLSFAQHLLETVTPYSPESKIRDMLREFITLCDENSQKGYVGAAYESLGLVTRTLHAQMVPVVDKQLSEIAPEVLGYFWHGAGRALYFLPIYIVPGMLSPWRAIDREPPHDVGRLNARAGLAWATALVNIRQPQIMENVVRYHGDQLSENDAFSNGVSSSLIMSWDITPGEVYITDFCQYQPDPSDQHLVELWNRLVKGPAENAVQRYHRVLQQYNRLEEVFHYQNLAELVDRLEKEPQQSASLAVSKLQGAASPR